ncbi:hypothetical protein SCA6_003946 [Theobroma cacao]
MNAFQEAALPLQISHSSSELTCLNVAIGGFPRYRVGPMAYISKKFNSGPPPNLIGPRACWTLNEQPQETAKTR